MQFIPDFMLYYIHGYNSSPNSRKGILFKEKLGAVPLKYIEGDKVVVEDCLKRIKESIEKDTKIMLIGSSFGGFLSARIALENRNVRKIILLNPAVIPPDVDLSGYDLPGEIVEDIQSSGLFERKIPCEVFIIMSTRDELIPKDWILRFAMFQEATVKFIEDDHRMNRNLEKLPEIISGFL
ncbi:alpha/beta fold hydrolase [bacterium]|nr:alpha/beta fold hydrolase [bacterium]